MSTDAKLLLWIFFIIVMMGYNYWVIERRNKKPDYKKQFVIKGIAAIIHAVYLTPEWTWSVDLWREWAPILFFQITSYWVIFNPSLNFFRNNGFWDLGKYSGWIDPFFIKRPGLHRVCYIAAVVGMIYCIPKIL